MAVRGHLRSHMPQPSGSTMRVTARERYKSFFSNLTNQPTERQALQDNICQHDRFRHGGVYCARHHA